MNYRSEVPAPEVNLNLNLTRLLILFSLLAAVSALFGTWYLLPYRVDGLEKRLAAVERQNEAQQELLVRIDENVQMIRREQAKKNQ